jgi:glycosyltransferase involved in cell wall biosynthesis
VTLHGGMFDVPAAELASLVAPQAGKMEWGRLPGALLGSRRVLADADAVICVGRREADKARAELGHDRVHHLPNGVDPENFAHGDGAAFRARHGIPAKARVVLCVSRYDPQKDQRLLVEAFERVAMGDARLVLVLAGPSTSPSYVAALDERIGASPVAGRIRRLGALAPEGPELADAFRAADMFALASRHEPFGIVALEAWCAGLPVIAARSGGLVDLVEDGRNGLLFEAGDTAGCAAAIRRCAADGEWAHACGAAGRAAVVRDYDWRRIAARLEEIYQAAERHARR